MAVEDVAVTDAPSIGQPSRAEWRKSAKEYRALSAKLCRQAEQRRAWGQGVIARQLLKDHIAAREMARRCAQRAREASHVG